MSRLHELEKRLEGLSDIREIVNSMKTLAYMETRKLARFLDAQRAVVASIEEVAGDLLAFYPEVLPEALDSPAVHLLIGSERGFCGDFNHALLRDLQRRLADHPPAAHRLVVVGGKLLTLLDGDPRVAAAIDGAGVVEEVFPLLSRLVDALSRLEARRGGITVFCLYHESEEEIVMKPLLPPFRKLRPGSAQFNHPPVLHQSPQDFMLELAEHYLFSALHEMLYTSLMAENRKRLSHLEGAVRHLDEESGQLARRRNALRQEEIIEEIEVILLSASTPRGQGPAPTRR
jgi:F-type H+-transporting ATPase subunit gamma